MAMNMNLRTTTAKETNDYDDEEYASYEEYHGEDANYDDHEDEIPIREAMRRVVA